MESPDSRSAIQALQADAKRIIKPLDAIVKIKAAKPEAIDKLNAAVVKLPEADVIGEAVSELRSKAESFLKEAVRDRTDRVKRAEAEFVRTAREEGKAVRELDSSWRIEALEIQLKREEGKARAAFNHEPVTRWEAIASREDLDRLEEEARTLLKEAEIPEVDLPGTFWEAFRSYRWRNRTEDRVPVADLYPEIRLERVRREIADGRPDRKITGTEFPRWAFLYNLDRYRALGSAIDGGRLAFETGSQAETGKIGVTVNGLKADQDYRKVCYVSVARG